MNDNGTVQDTQTAVEPVETTPPAKQDTEPTAGAGDEAKASAPDAKVPATQDPAGDQSDEPKVGGLMAGDDKGDDKGDDGATAVKPGEASVLGAPEGDYTFSQDESLGEFDPTVIKDFGAVAKELNLSNDAAQKIVSKMAPAFAKAQAEAITQYSKTWAEQSRNDPEFGGAGFDANLKGIREAYNAFTTPELRQVMARTGLDNHPEFLRLFHRLAKESGGGRFLTSSGKQGENNGNDLTKFYKGMNP